jgi:phosphotransferase system  glucose/maltose/N-acetylglucosamine-specific IIC component
MAQSGAPMDMDANEIAYYANQSAWLAALTDVALLAAILAAVALLLRSGWAVNLFGLSIVAIALSSLFDIANGTALLIDSREWLVVWCLTAGLAIAQFLYARVMQRRGVLR